MSRSQRSSDIHRLRRTSTAVANLYIQADRKRRLLDPLLHDTKIAESFGISLASHGANLLRLTLFTDLIRDLSAFVLDDDHRVASLRNIWKDLRDEECREAVWRDYYKTLPAKWLGNSLDPETLREIQEDMQHRRQIEKSGDFLVRNEQFASGCNVLFKSALARRVSEARHKLVAHYELAPIENDDELIGPADIGLKWTDAADFMDASESLIFEAHLLIHRASFDLKGFTQNHKRCADDFWAKLLNLS